MPKFLVKLRALALACALVVTGAVPGCSPGAGERDPLTRRTFVDTYVALRWAAVRDPGGVISNAERDNILAERETTEEDLLAFAETRGADADYMEAVWDEIETRLESLRLQADTSK